MKQRCRDATSSPVLTFQPNHSLIPALSDDIEHSMQTSRFPVYLYIYLSIYIYIYSQIQVGICYHQRLFPTVANTHWVFSTVANTHH